MFVVVWLRTIKTQPSQVVEKIGQKYLNKNTHIILYASSSNYVHYTCCLPLFSLFGLTLVIVRVGSKLSLKWIEA